MSAATETASGELLAPSFYERSVHDVARDLIGCSVRFNGIGGVIAETESYEREDPACHAYVGRTARTEVLFGPPGRAYVYLSYGIHSLLNFVAEPEGDAAAVLIRAIEPVWGLEEMRARRGLERHRDLCSGPGKLTQALGIGLEVNRTALDEAPFEIRRRAGDGPGPKIVAGPRIGITKAADLPWRFCAGESAYLSAPVG